MSSKTALLLLTISVLMTSLLTVNLQQANALIQRDFSMYDDSHTTASYGISKVCGNHICAPGEHAQWVKALWDSQRTGYGNSANAQHGENIMHSMATSSTTSSGNMKMSGSMSNMTGNMPHTK